MPLHVTEVKKGPGGHTSYDFIVEGEDEQPMEERRCRGTCGRKFFAEIGHGNITDCVIEYKDGYCKDCYIESIEKELNKIRKSWINPEAGIY